MKLRATSLLVVVSLVAGVLASSCGDFGGKPSKMSTGELYESGDAKYDPYFKKIHDEQVAAANWAEESKAARKPLCSALNLPPNAGNSAIVSAIKEAKEKGSSGAVHSAAEETAALEKAFAEKQRSNADRLDKLAIEGAELKKQSVDDRRNMAADKADPAKVDKKDDVKHEVSAAADIAVNLRDDARRGVQEIERLIEALRKDLGVIGDGAGIPKNDEPAKKDDAKKDDKKADGKKSDGKKDDGKKSDGKKDEGKKSESKPATKKPESKPAAEAKPAEEKPAAKPAPTQKPSDNEVFNP